MAEDNSSNTGAIQTGNVTVDPNAVTTVETTEQANVATTTPVVDTVVQTSLQNAQAPAPQLSKINREFQEKAIKKQAEMLGMPYVDIAKTPLNPDFLKLLDTDTARNAKVVPVLKSGNRVSLAVCNLESPATIDAIQKLKNAGYEVVPSLASEDGIDFALNAYFDIEKFRKINIVENVEEKSIETYEKELANLSQLDSQLDKLTADEGLNLLNIGAMKTSASDIHYEPEESFCVVRFRIDGMLHEVFRMSMKNYKKIAEQIKYKSRMLLNVNTVPQDGRYLFNLNEIKIAVRVSSIPTPFGESFVCRYLRSDRKALTIEDLGFEGTSLARLKDAAKIAQGMVLITGPTGSGKSTTLYSMLNLMNTPENKIITLEDPVEYYMKGVTQSQVDENNNYTFANGLRTILRQDPDIVMLGEIRDLETAETATQAALTGHVLLSTLHTNSAIETIPRLINMGLKPFMVAPSLHTLVAQRLVRKVCQKCLTKRPIADTERAEFDKVFADVKTIIPTSVLQTPSEVVEPHGCDACSSTGYAGRIVINEVVTVSSNIKQLILNNSSMADLLAVARKEGMVTMREDGFMKVSRGLTTLEEVERVIGIVVE